MDKIAGLEPGVYFEVEQRLLETRHDDRRTARACVRLARFAADSRM